MRVVNIYSENDIKITMPQADGRKKQTKTFKSKSIT